MPKRMYNPLDSGCHAHQVRRPGYEYTMKSGDMTHASTHPRWKWQNRRSPWLKGDPHKRMREVVGGSGKTAVYRPTMVQHVPMMGAGFSPAPAKGVLAEQLKPFLGRGPGQHQPPALSSFSEESRLLLPSQRRLDAQYPLQPVEVPIKAAASYSAGLTAPPRTAYYHGDRGMPPLNAPPKRVEAARLFEEAPQRGSGRLLFGARAREA
eukprot:TRINITY_DN16454_c0_g1_i1.p1 TRINITY_DN16454_c0_g1~~TRINITY_DN16454_c0_g1_i1.p1  ORF type:complete len:208 (+),score=59.66 TRINITY_DN16454_c0_g1_i1:91-714(+)